MQLSALECELREKQQAMQASGMQLRALENKNRDLEASTRSLGRLVLA
jgi:hypothetical protein